MIKRFISSFLTCFGLLLVVCISYGETFNFYYITENKRGHSHDFDDNSAHKNIISRPSISLIIIRKQKKNSYFKTRHANSKPQAETALQIL
ncbi:hypothetical protein ABEB36_008841 [Hypothenemus hampei]|uniref:Uncharacterized protein n=1 Tax=Hypothenemus hampei TaxID=57062 RepID=A0ABD1ENT6_HYPHA